MIMYKNKIVIYILTFSIFLFSFYVSQAILYKNMTEPYLGYLIRSCLAGSPVPIELCELLPGYQATTANAAYGFSATLAFFVSLSVYRIGKMLFAKSKDND